MLPKSFPTLYKRVGAYDPVTRGIHALSLYASVAASRWAWRKCEMNPSIWAFQHRAELPDDGGLAVELPSRS